MDPNEIRISLRRFGSAYPLTRGIGAGPRATDAYEPRQVRKEAAISKAGCVAGFPAFRFAGATAGPDAAPAPRSIERSPFETIRPAHASPVVVGKIDLATLLRRA